MQKRRLFPPRTIILMLLTLVAFGWFWWQTHRYANEPVAPPAPARDAGAGRPSVQFIPIDEVITTVRDGGRP